MKVKWLGFRYWLFNKLDKLDFDDRYVQRVICWFGGHVAQRHYTETIGFHMYCEFCNKHLCKGKCYV